MDTEFIPEDFQVPISLEAEAYRLEILGPEVTELDYEAVMSSKARLRSVFSDATEWPRDDMTLDENRVDLIRHKREFLSREAFAYTVLTLDRTKCIGCVYIRPSKVSQFDSKIYLWVRDEYIQLDDNLYSTIKNWLIENWPFKNFIFPGRDVSWLEWATYSK